MLPILCSSERQYELNIMIKYGFKLLEVVGRRFYILNRKILHYQIFPSRYTFQFSFSNRKAAPSSTSCVLYFMRSRGDVRRMMTSWHFLRLNFSIDMVDDFKANVCFKVTHQKYEISIDRNYVCSISHNPENLFFKFIGIPRVILRHENLNK